MIWSGSRFFRARSRSSSGTLAFTKARLKSSNVGQGKIYATGSVRVSPVISWMREYLDFVMVSGMMKEAGLNQRELNRMVSFLCATKEKYPKISLLVPRFVFLMVILV